MRAICSTVTDSSSSALRTRISISGKDGRSTRPAESSPARPLTNRNDSSSNSSVGLGSPRADPPGMNWGGWDRWSDRGVASHRLQSHAHRAGRPGQWGDVFTKEAAADGRCCTIQPERRAETMWREVRVPHSVAAASQRGSCDPPESSVTRFPDESRGSCHRPASRRPSTFHKRRASCTCRHRAAPQSHRPSTRSRYRQRGGRP